MLFRSGSPRIGDFKHSGSGDLRFHIDECGRWVESGGLNQAGVRASLLNQRSRPLLHFDHLAGVGTAHLGRLFHLSPQSFQLAFGIGDAVGNLDLLTRSFFFGLESRGFQLGDLRAAFDNAGFQPGQLV